jgi:hypothetical protein
MLRRFFTKIQPPTSSPKQVLYKQPSPSQKKVIDSISQARTCCMHSSKIYCLIALNDVLFAFQNYIQNPEDDENDLTS